MGDFSKLAERRIREAQERGEFDHLPGEGKPLDLETNSPIPAPLRMAYAILKRHGLLPREAELLKRIDEARERVEAASDEATRQRELAQLEALCLEYNTTRQRPVELEKSSLDDDR